LWIVWALADTKSTTFDYFRLSAHEALELIPHKDRESMSALA
jgi:hypothetical protein